MPLRADVLAVSIVGTDADRGLQGGAGGDEEHDQAGVRGSPQKVIDLA